MSNSNNIILFDSVKGIMVKGEFSGSIISNLRDSPNSIVFSDNIVISENGAIFIQGGLKVGFETISNKRNSFSRKSDFNWDNGKTSLEYALKIPDNIMKLYDEGQVSNSFPFTINLLHTATLYLNDYESGINHLDFFKGEIIKNPVCLILNGICVADRVVIDDYGNPVFYDCLIVGRDQNDDLNVSYEPLVNVDDNALEYIVILGNEELKV